MSNSTHKVGFVSLEGYIVGRLTVMALETIEGEPTREALMKAITETGEFDLGGVILRYGPRDFQGMDEVFLTVIQPDGSFKSVERLSTSG